MMFPHMLAEGPVYIFVTESFIYENPSFEDVTLHGVHSPRYNMYYWQFYL